MYPWHRLPQEKLLQGCRNVPAGSWHCFLVDGGNHTAVYLVVSLRGPFCCGLLRVEKLQVPITPTTVCCWQYCTNRDCLIPTYELVHDTDSQGAISKTHSTFNIPYGQCETNGEWRLTVGYHGLNEDMPPLSAVMPDGLKLHYKLKSKAAKCYARTDITNTFFSNPLTAACRPLLAFT